MFYYRREEAKPCDKWSTFVKIELKETLVDRRKRFAINDYGGFKNKAAEKGAGKLDFQLGVKHKKPDPPEFPNGRLYTANTGEEWIIYKECLFGNDGKEYELVGRSIFEFTCHFPMPHLPLAACRNRDRMDVDTVIEICTPDVQQVLANAKLIVQTLIP